MRIPTIHLNGTSANELVAQIERALTALTVAIDAVNQTAPNGRDYYPQGCDALAVAGREHRARVDRLHDTKSELQALHEGIDAQLNGRGSAERVLDGHPSTRT